MQGTEETFSSNIGMLLSKILLQGPFSSQEQIPHVEAASSVTLHPDEELKERIEILLDELRQTKAEVQMLRRQVGFASQLTVERRLYPSIAGTVTSGIYTHRIYRLLCALLTLAGACQVPRLASANEDLTFEAMEAKEEVLILTVDHRKEADVYKEDVNGNAVPMAHSILHICLLACCKFY